MRTAARENAGPSDRRVCALVWLGIYVGLIAIKKAFEVINQTWLYERSFLFLSGNRTAFLFNSKKSLYDQPLGKPCHCGPFQAHDKGSRRMKRGSSLLRVIGLARKQGGSALRRLSGGGGLFFILVEMHMQIWEKGCYQKI